MSANSIGKIFKVTTFGESHGKMIGVVVDGCPAGLKIDLKFIQKELDRRRPGQSKITTKRNESDKVEIVSGVFEGKSTGAPIAAFIINQDQRSQDYDHLKENFRPSHADFTYEKKYGHRDYRGGGRSSARETAARVIAGAIAKMVLKHYKIKIEAYVSKVGKIELSKKDKLDFKKRDQNIVRCPNPIVAKKMIALIQKTQKEGDTIGGVISALITGVPIGLGAPVFDKLHADLGKAMLSINAVKGFEFGSGFKGVELNGSLHNDSFEKVGSKIMTKTNHSGGIQGGISNGMPIEFRVAFRPVGTIMKDQWSVDKNGKKVVVSGKGRHDPCVVPRAVPIVEAMAAIILVDHLLRSKTVRLN